ncbi:MAG: hypothetical protein A2W28_12475 [Gammaproteobacteria bacterium RBG_16_51_14]|nr:MAG: hypothetical protein A2W28_12475 [Gammaproteobacteria bacterium RBG_16_51_14]
MPAKKPEHVLLLLWLMLTGLVFFGAVVCVDQGLIREMINSDRSHICLVLIAMYLIGLGHTFIRILYLSRELRLATCTGDLLCSHPAEQLHLDGNYIRIAGGPTLPAGFITDYMVDLIRSVPAARHGDATIEQQNDLLEAYASKFRSTHEFGWFYIDLMLKVGFLGTLVGFILMLSSVANIGVLDSASMQKVLIQMSIGMSTALYTTLASLVGGILLGIPYHLLDRGLNVLLENAVYLKEVQILPRLSATA